MNCVGLSKDKDKIVGFQVSCARAVPRNRKLVITCIYVTWLKMAHVFCLFLAAFFTVVGAQTIIYKKHNRTTVHTFGSDAEF